MSAVHEGHCHICNDYGKLTFEHFPPKSAYNDKPIRYYKGDQLFKLMEERKYTEQQQGFGDYTLCERCNTYTGTWYVPSFTNFIIRGMEYVRNGYQGTTDIPFCICPANVLKELVAIMFSVHQYGLCVNQPYLTKYVLNKGQQYLPQNIRFFVFIPVPQMMRKTGRMGMLKISPQIHMQETYIYCEFLYPPFGYIMTFDDRSGNMQSQEGLAEVTYFSQYKYDECDVVWLKIPIMKIMPDIQ